MTTYIYKLYSLHVGEGTMFEQFEDAFETLEESKVFGDKLKDSALNDEVGYTVYKQISDTEEENILELYY